MINALLFKMGVTELFGVKLRHPDWPKVRKAHLEKHPTCAVCGGTKGLEVHHIEPFHLKPELELDPNNFITLCGNSAHHLTFGHLMNFRSFNPNVVQDAAAFLEKIKNRT